MKYNNAIEFLKNSMLYQMSLGSKELFHSNVWWWLINNDKNFIKVFIPNFNLLEYTTIKVERETKHRDLIIKLSKNRDNEHIVIENKIKSLPTIDQLERYTKDIDKYKFKQGVLTGIGECDIDLSLLKTHNNTCGLWTYVSYDEIATRILDIAKISESEVVKNHLEQIGEYCEIIKCINFVLDENINYHKDILVYNDKGELDSLRIKDIFQKLKASSLKNYILQRQQILESIKPNRCSLHIWQSYSNSTPYVDVRFNIDNKKSIITLIAVQIQGNAFRIAIQKNDSISNINSDELYKKFIGIWFDDSFDYKANRKIFNYDSSMHPKEGKKYDSYKTAEYCFIYQYFNVNSLDDKSYEAIFNLIFENMVKAAYIINNLI